MPQAKVEQELKETKVYFTLSRALELVPHRRIPFGIIPRTQLSLVIK